MLRDDATRAKQESVGEVAEADFRAGAEWAECGGVLRRTQAVCATFLRLEKAPAGSSRVATAAGRPGRAVRGSKTGGRGASGEPSERLAGGDSTPEWPESAGGCWIRRAAFASVAGGGGERGMIGLPSLHALDWAQMARIWLAGEATDMRCGFDRLAERVQVVIGRVAAPLRGVELERGPSVAPRDRWGF